MRQDKMPLLTVGIPFYNNEKTLAAAINSVLIQTYYNFELILIDDGSTDKSYDVAYEFAQKDPRVQLLCDGENKGLVSRLNQIIDLAKGDYIARMDSDDMMMPEKLEKQMKVLMANDKIDVVDTAAFIINEKDAPTGLRKMFDISNWSKKNVLQKRLMFHPTIVAKTSWYKKNKYDEAFRRSEDFELWCRSFEGSVFARVYEPLFFYREGKVNINNYVASCRSHARAVWRHYRGVLSTKEAVSEVMQSHLKAMLYRVFGWFNKQDILASKRNIELTKGEISKAENLIKRIKRRDFMYVIPPAQKEEAKAV